MEKELNAEDPLGSRENELEQPTPPGVAENERVRLPPAEAGESEEMQLKRLEFEFKLQMRSMDLEADRIALRKIELQNSPSRPPSAGSESSDRRHPSLDPVAQCSKVLKGYRLPCDADVPLWFDEVEKLFTTFEVPENSRVHLIMPVLTERVRYLLRNLSQQDCSDYDAVKQAVLDELKLTPAEYLERFESAAKRKDETWAQFTSRVRTYFAYYLTARGADSKETVTELMVADRIKASLSAEGLEYVRLREGKVG